MAGYTSRILLTLIVPSVFSFLSVLWFLKKKQTTSKALWKKSAEVKEKADSGENILGFENHYPVLTSMKLKEKDPQPQEIQEGSSEMQLKENGTVTEKHTHSENIKSTPSPKSKGKKKAKSKIHGIGNMCVEKAPATSSCMRDNASSVAEDSRNNITNGLEAVSLSDSPTSNGVSKTCKTSNNGSLTVAAKPVKLYSCHFKTQTETPKAKMGDSSCTKIATSESVIQRDLKPAKELCDIKSTCERNCNPQASASDNTKPNVHQQLILPIHDCSVNGASQPDMLESPGAKYCDSVGSNDSGKGGSEFQFVLDQNTYYIVYEFEILQELCGLLIGRNGRHVNFIKQETNANILIKNHPYFQQMKICSITGTEDEIHAALKLIRKRFPVEIYPTVTLSQINTIPLEFQLPESLKLCLPEGVSFESMLCATVNAGHFFLQQPTHPTFHSLPALTTQMTALYSQLETPTLSHFAKGYVCTACLTDGWFRAEIDEVLETTEECRLKFLDYGGYTVVPRSSLRQIRYDFMHVPFQATECYLGSVTFLEGESSWSPEATAIFEELAQGQIVQGYIIGYAENRVPYVHLHKITGATTVFINRELVDRGVARWIDGPQ